MRKAACLLALACGLAQAQPAADAWQRLDIRDGQLPAAQRTIRVNQGDSLRWRIASNAPGELHLHAYRLVAAVQPGRPAELAFSAHGTGRFRIEWHPAAAAHAPPATHHGPPLATLEVRPR